MCYNVGSRGVHFYSSYVAWRYRSLSTVVTTIYQLALGADARRAGADCVTQNSKRMVAVLVGISFSQHDFLHDDYHHDKYHDGYLHDISEAVCS